MLQQSYITSTQPLSFTAPAPVVVRSAIESRALVAFQLILITGTNEHYLSHASFHQAFESGYTYNLETGEFEEEEVTLERLLDFIEREFSPVMHHNDNKVAAFFRTEPLPYAHYVGFVLGVLRWLFDADRAPSMPLSLLQKWYSIEYLTRSVASRFVARD